MLIKINENCYVGNILYNTNDNFCQLKFGETTNLGIVNTSVHSKIFFFILIDPWNPKNHIFIFILFLAPSKFIYFYLIKIHSSKISAMIWESMIL